MSVSEPIPIRFGKQILKNSIKFSEPNWIRFGNKKQYLSPEKILNRIQFGSEKRQYSRGETILNRILFGSENLAISLKNLLICSSAHLNICSSAHLLISSSSVSASVLHLDFFMSTYEEKRQSRAICYQIPRTFQQKW